MKQKKSIHKQFKQIMMLINVLLVLPVVWVLIREITAEGPAKPARILASAALMAVPLCGTAAITVAGSAVLSDD
ncbi:MAG: hypothetical protein CVU89_08955 [Firmicutes bacterium HGW-Firmicutes-14]|nr:MAG: hypothetical protein CVU89_08955 [Firmicutes bacterium HGW-Firmicutes-14]